MSTMNNEQAMSIVEAEFNEYKANNKDEFLKSTGYKHRNMEILYLKRRLADIKVENHAMKTKYTQLNDLYIESEIKLNQLKKLMQ